MQIQLEYYTIKDQVENIFTKTQCQFKQLRYILEIMLETQVIYKIKNCNNKIIIKVKEI